MFRHLKLKTKLLIIFVIVGLPVLLAGFTAIYSINLLIKPVQVNIPDLIKDISNKTHLNNLVQDIKYYDEILTQSIRNYAFTHDEKWKKRYNDNVFELDLILKEVVNLGDESDQDCFSKIDEANLLLVNMEKEAIKHVDNKDFSLAIEILESEAYAIQKAIYQENLNEYTNRQLIEEDQALESSLKSLLNTNDSISNNLRTLDSILLFLTIITFIAVIFLGIFTVGFITKRLSILKDIAKDIMGGDLEVEIDEKLLNSVDEIGDLARTFRDMLDRLNNYYGDLQNEVEKKTQQLENAKKETEEKLIEASRLNKNMVDRELKMAELKNENKKLKELLDKQKEN